MLVLFNDSCSKCAALSDDLGDADWTPVRYLNGELTAEVLDAFLEGYEGPLSDLVRTKEPAWIEGGFRMEALSPDELREIVLRHPIVLQRPIALKNGRTIIARDLERFWDVVNGQPT
jgi:arsenate reductase (glutaredoxin)